MLDSRNTTSTAYRKDTFPQGHQQDVGKTDKEVGAVGNTAPTIENSPLTVESETDKHRDNPSCCATWSYVHVHYKRVDKLERDQQEYQDAPSSCFVPRTPITRTTANGKRIRHDSKSYLTIGGLVFFQGTPNDIQRYLKTHYFDLHLVKDPATNKPAIIPHHQMEPFMRMAIQEPSLVKIMDHPISHYAQGHKRMRILTGLLKGHEGYVVRKAGDRKFLLQFGNKSLSISNIHKELFEEVKK